MRVLLSTYDSRGDVEPLVGLAVRLRELGAEVRVCAPPDCAGGWPRSACRRCHSASRCARWCTGPRFRSAADEPRRAAELEAVQFDTVAAAAEGRDVLVATGVMPAGVWR